ncbi:pyruvate kinase [Mycoplasmopsis felifaucium]|uniref:Pyruvate kinase n=1 Tax=Mycoplasmopsis felifaucium TaxID=35768 RepID=A0ABZ2RQ99_9BACT|nr:pyruvate kinase [Mycoplasmopsis felifaucium]
MNLTDKRSKLVVTIGPSSDNYNTLRALVEGGATCVRANFSHGSHEEHLNKFLLAKKVSEDMHLPVSLMLDTKGPEIRLGAMKDGAQVIPANHEIKIYTTEKEYKEFEGTADEVTVSYDMSKDLKEGNVILFDDGKLTSIVTKVGKGFVVAKTLNAHKLKTNKRINLPGVDFSLPFLSQKDIDDVKFGIKVGVHYIAASFVNSAQNVNDLRQLLDENGGKNIKIISKIESHLGIKNIDEIIQASDGIMVARGDLGLEIPYYDVPYFEKVMIRKCREAGKPIIVATQMLDSMENNPHPTRAEVTDVYYATELGADATMLSGESASGSYPVESVLTMTNINKRAEMEFYDKTYYDIQLEEIRRKSNPAQNKRARIAYEVANRTRFGDYKFAVVLSRTGKLLEEVAKFRPNTIIVGIVNDESLIGEFGVTSSVWVSLDSKKYFDLIKQDKKVALETLAPYGIKEGDRILVVENESMTEMKF